MQGIQAGDVITEVNGIALYDQKQALSALRSAVKEPKLEMTMLRDGREVSTTIRFNQ